MTADHVVRGATGVPIAVHELGGDGPPLLVSHATGFCARVYRALAEQLAGQRRVLGVDLHGHGLTPSTGQTVTWDRLGDDLLAVVDDLGLHGCDGFGHSMGGAALLFAEHRRPGSFRSLFLYEPIVFPDAVPPPQPNPLAVGARRRRETFPTAEAALWNFASKPPLRVVRADVLRDYVDHGFAPTADGGVTLRCTGEAEARTYEGETPSRSARFVGLEAPTTVAVGQEPPSDIPPPPAWAPELVDRLADARLIVIEELGHFGPFEHPPSVAAAVSAHLNGVGRRASLASPPID